MNYTSQAPTAPAGFEIHHSLSSIGRRVLLSHTEVRRMLASGELKARPGRDCQYKSSDLDALRAANVAKVSAKFQHLTADEQQRTTAMAAEFAHLHAGLNWRTKPNGADAKAGQQVATTVATRGHRSGMGVRGPRMVMKLAGGLFG